MEGERVRKTVTRPEDKEKSQLKVTWEEWEESTMNREANDRRASRLLTTAISLMAVLNLIVALVTYFHETWMTISLESKWYRSSVGKVSVGLYKKCYRLSSTAKETCEGPDGLPLGVAAAHAFQTIAVFHHVLLAVGTCLWFASNVRFGNYRSLLVYLPLANTIIGIIGSGVFAASALELLDYDDVTGVFSFEESHIDTDKGVWFAWPFWLNLVSSIFCLAPYYVPTRDLDMEQPIGLDLDDITSGDALKVRSKPRSRDFPLGLPALLRAALNICELNDRMAKDAEMDELQEGDGMSGDDEEDVYEDCYEETPFERELKITPKRKTTKAKSGAKRGVKSKQVVRHHQPDHPALLKELEDWLAGMESRRKRGDPGKNSREPDIPWAAGKSSPRSAGQMSPRSAGNLSPRAAGRMSPRAAGNLSPRAAERMSPRAAGNLSPRTAGNLSPRAAGNLSPRTAGNLSPRTAGNRGVITSAQAELHQLRNRRVVGYQE